MIYQYHPMNQVEYWAMGNDKKPIGPFRFYADCTDALVERITLTHTEETPYRYVIMRTQNHGHTPLTKVGELWWRENHAERNGIRCYSTPEA